MEQGTSFSFWQDSIFSNSDFQFTIPLEDTPFSNLKIFFSSAIIPMKTFNDSSYVLEAYLLVDESNYRKGVAIIDYGFLLAELFQLLGDEVNYKEIVALLPKVCN